MQPKLELFADQCGLCIIDIQEKLAAAVPEKVLKGTLRNCLNLIESARVLGLPIAVTEQHPAGLGRTLPVLAESVLRLPTESVAFFPKMRFSPAASKTFAEWVRSSRRTQWILVGMETHVCVFQLARDLVAAGYEVHVPRDAVVSRSMANWETGLQLLTRAGAVVTGTETVIFDLIKDASSEQFRMLSNIVK